MLSLLEWFFCRLHGGFGSTIIVVDLQLHQAVIRNYFFCKLQKTSCGFLCVSPWVLGVVSWPVCWTLIQQPRGLRYHRWVQRTRAGRACFGDEGTRIGWVEWSRGFFGSRSHEKFMAMNLWIYSSIYQAEATDVGNMMIIHLKNLQTT